MADLTSATDMDRAERDAYEALCQAQEEAAELLAELGDDEDAMAAIEGARDGRVTARSPQIRQTVREWRAAGEVWLAAQHSHAEPAVSNPRQT